VKRPVPGAVLTDVGPPADDHPAVRLGETAADGIAPTMLALLERGIARRPEVVHGMRGRVQFRFEEDIAPVRICFEPGAVTVEDGEWESSDLVVAGRLPHVVELSTTPMLGGIPNPATRRGRRALERLRRGQVTVRGDRALGRRLLRLLEL